MSHLQKLLIKTFKFITMNKNEKPLFSVGGLSQSDVVTMVKRYYANLANPPAFDPKTYVKSVWFPKKEIDYIQSQLGIEGGDGVRVYFGNYPDADSSGTAFPNPSSNTVIFVSTKWDGTSHVDYFTETETPHFDPENRGEQCQPNCGGTIQTQ
jgi:hypothetical protein